MLMRLSPDGEMEGYEVGRRINTLGNEEDAALLLSVF